MMFGLDMDKDTKKRFIPIAILLTCLSLTILLRVFYLGRQQINKESVSSPQTTSTAVNQISEKKDIIGKVKSVDTKPWAVDGNAVIILTTTDNSDIKILIPSGESACQFPNIAVVYSIKEGDKVNVKGKFDINASTITICDQTDYIDLNK
jgi:hypothetical protein